MRLPTWRMLGLKTQVSTSGIHKMRKRSDVYAALFCSNNDMPGARTARNYVSNSDVVGYEQDVRGGE